MTPPAPKELEALLAHAGWIRSLARTLVSDPNRADDLVQQTWVAALEHPPGPSVSLRRWLAAVMRNFARQVRRGELRRIDRESQSARPEARPSAHESVEAIAVQRELFEAVIGLEEPYRTTIFERFYEDILPREIARRHGVPVKTVKTRLSRGLEKLRADLDRRHKGRREAWLPALLPLAGWPGLPAPTVGMLVMNTKLKIAAVALLLVGALAVVWTSSSGDGGPSAALASAEQPELASEPARAGSTLTEPSGTERREGATEPMRTAQPSASRQATVTLVRGRVIDTRGTPMPGVPLCSCVRVLGTGLETFRSAEHATNAAVATSASDGSFEAPMPQGGTTFVACGPDLTTVFAADVWSSRALQEIVVVVAPRGGVAGRVVDPEGSPIAEAEVEIRPSASVLRGLGAITDQSFEMPWRARTDDRGRFEILDAPAMGDAELAITAVGWSEANEPAPDRPAFDLRIVLRREEEEVLRGEVVDPEGRPVPGARVACGGEVTRADEEGRFVLRPGSNNFMGTNSFGPDAILALKEGWLPARFVKPEQGWPARITLQLQGEPLAILGRVVDAEGEGMAGVEVWAIDEHGFGIEMEEVGHVGFHKSIERLLRGGAETVGTESDGSFVLGGLLPGRYRLGCLQRETLLSVKTEPTEAGARDVVIRLGNEVRCVRIAGRVRYQGGAPVAGIQVFPGHSVEHWPYGQPMPVFGDATMTDAEGRFEFDRMSPEGLSLQIASPDIFLVDWKPTAESRLDELEIIVSRRCHLQVDLGDRKDLADSFYVLDANGKRLMLIEHRGPIATMGETAAITDGLSPVKSVPEEGRIVVLQKGLVEVARLPIDLVPGELRVLRP